MSRTYGDQCLCPFFVIIVILELVKTKSVNTPVSDRPKSERRGPERPFMPSLAWVCKFLLFKFIFRRNLRRQSRDNHAKRVRKCCSLCCLRCMNWKAQIWEIQHFVWDRSRINYNLGVFVYTWDRGQATWLSVLSTWFPDLRFRLDNLKSTVNHGTKFLRSSTRPIVQSVLLLVEECTWSERRTIGRVTLYYHRSLEEIAECRSFARWVWTRC